MQHVSSDHPISGNSGCNLLLPVTLTTYKYVYRTGFIIHESFKMQSNKITKISLISVSLAISVSLTILFLFVVGAVFCLQPKLLLLERSSTQSRVPGQCVQHTHLREGWPGLDYTSHLIHPCRESLPLQPGSQSANP